MGWQTCSSAQQEPLDGGSSCIHCKVLQHAASPSENAVSCSNPRHPKGASSRSVATALGNELRLSRCRLPPSPLALSPPLLPTHLFSPPFLLFLLSSLVARDVATGV